MRSGTAVTPNEFDPHGPIELKEVEEVFETVAPIINVYVGGQIIRTTREHPFYVEGRGWIAAAFLETGDLLSTRHGGLVVVEGVADSGQVATVYNWRIAEYHTYFVSVCDAGPSVWAHNAYDGHHGTPRQIIRRRPPHIRAADIQGRRGKPNITPVGRRKHQDAHNGRGGRPRYNDEFQRRLDAIEKRRPLTAADYWRIRAKMLLEYFGIS